MEAGLKEHAGACAQLHIYTPKPLLCSPSPLGVIKMLLSTIGVCEQAIVLF